MNNRSAETKVAQRLHHVWCEDDEKFFARIDQFGGWPVGMKYVSFAHSDERECEFGNHYLRTGWWTTIATADDYYRWKLSPEAMKKIEKEIRDRIAMEIRR